MRTPPDTALDLASLAYSAYTGDAAGFTMDLLSLVIPGVTGLSAISRADDALRALNRLDNVYDTTHTIRAINNATNTVQYANRADNYYDANRFAQPFSPPCMPINSFSADTEVSTKDGETQISLIEIGDYVLAWDESTDTLGWYQVTDTIHRTDEVVTHVIIDGE